jgi:hypothetical protein
LTSQVEQKRTQRDTLSGFCGIVLALSIIALAAGYGFNRSAHEPGLVAGLMSLPVVAQLIGLVFIYWRRHIKSFSMYYAFMMSACVFSTYVLWIAYNWNYRSRKWSILSLIAIAVITSFVLVMTIAIMRVDTRNRRTLNPNANVFVKFIVKCMTCVSPKLGNLKDDVAQEPFLALLLFFSAFLCISYLFGLAFAFYDKTGPQKGGKPALFMRNLYPDVVDSESKQSTDSNESPSHHTIHFRTARAVPDIEDCDIKKYMPSLLGQKSQKAKEMWDTVNRRSQNFQNLKEAAEEIQKYTAGNHRVSVVLIGRADDTSTKGTPYSSNYELSQARAQNVQMKLIERLSIGNANWLNIEWSIVPLSNEPAVIPTDRLFSSENNGARSNPSGISSAADNRAVEVNIESVDNEIGELQMQRLQLERKTPPNLQLDLMDYIYFANYTITTTGYGDIMPTTPYSKFLCSLANIFEVFFLVVFFNALLSLRRDQRESSVPSATPVASKSQAGDGNANKTGTLQRFLEFFGFAAR